MTSTTSSGSLNSFDIFWPQMDIHRDDVDVIMGIDDERNDISYATPMNEFRKGVL